MVSHIPADSKNQFAVREAEKDRQRMEQIQARKNNPNFIYDPALSGLQRPAFVSSFGRK